MWLQGDAAGNANGEVVNNSGTIETQNGDITINTGHLLNTRDGFKVTQQTTQLILKNGIGNSIINVPITDLPAESYGYYVKSGTRQVGPCNGHGACNYVPYTNYYYAPFAERISSNT